MSRANVSINRTAEGVRIVVPAPGATDEIIGRFVVYGFVVAFAVFALVSSGFGLVAWLATVPFAIGGAFLLYLTALYARMRIDIVIDGSNCVVTARGLRSHQSMSGRSEDVAVTGPLGDGPTSNLLPLRLRALRFSYSDQELDLGHGHSSADLRSLLRELKPYVGSVREVE